MSAGLLFGPSGIASRRTNQDARVSGAYVLDMRFDREANIIVGSGRRPKVVRVGPGGAHFHVGSAQGGRLDNRVARHLRREMTSRWHIDRLVRGATTVNPLLRIGQPKEDACRVVQAVAVVSGVEVVWGVGNLDCRSYCASHLLVVPPWAVRDARDAAARVGREVECAAYHEAGHGVVGWALGCAPTTVSVSADASADAYVAGEAGFDDRQFNLPQHDHQAILAAGGEAERLWCPWLSSFGLAARCGDDYKALSYSVQFDRWRSLNVPEDERPRRAKAALASAKTAARRILKKNWPLVAGLASAVLLAPDHALTRSTTS